MACCNSVVPGGSLDYTYIFAEREEEYLVIERVPCGGDGVANKVERIEDNFSTLVEESRKMKKRNVDSCDLGYAREKQDVTTETEDEDEEEKEWCVINYGDARPAGIYNCRLVKYDDTEAEGNIHITDSDL